MAETDDEEWPPRRCLLKAAEILKDVCGRLAERCIALQPEMDQRTGILAASLMRSQRMMAAIEVLAAHTFMEEMWALMRSLSELVIDTAYLTLCPDAEVDQFVQYTHVAHFRLLDVFERDVSLHSSEIDAEDRRFMGQTVQQVKNKTGLESNARSWTRLSTIDRAKKIDKLFAPADANPKVPSKAFLSFAQGIFASGHLYAHSSFECLWPYIKCLKDGTPLSTPDREERVDHVLSGANHCLVTLAGFANQHMRLEFGSFINLAYELTETARRQSARTPPLR